MKRVARGILLVLVSAALPGLAYAQKGPCAADVAKLCAGVERGQGHVRQCLLAHQSELSKECQDRLGAVEAQRAQKQMKMGLGTPGAGQPPRGLIECRQDVRQHCSGVRRGGGRILQCLHEHEAELSEGCRKALGK